ncbi:MAG: glycogen-binding domain-containing protein [Elusimicrobiales bacterium]|nr:glycogen-binding domain-containing protein [Elusimicrobiales bacterium]
MAIKKSKSFWMIMIVVNIAIISASGHIIYKRLNTHFMPQVKEIHPVPVPISVKAEAVEDEAAPLSAEARKFLAENIPAQDIKKEPLKPSVIEDTKKSSTKTIETVKAKKTKKSKKVRAIKTVFKYKNLKAKSVSVSGSFTKWKNIKMEKKKGVWQANIWILPGTYLFHYAVDGEKVLDSSKPKASIGESIIDVTN